jgi:hypothetical protein
MATAFIVFSDRRRCCATCNSRSSSAKAWAKGHWPPGSLLEHLMTEFDVAACHRAPGNRAASRRKHFVITARTRSLRRQAASKAAPLRVEKGSTSWLPWRLAGSRHIDEGHQPPRVDRKGQHRRVLCRAADGVRRELALPLLTSLKGPKFTEAADVSGEPLDGF